MSDLPQELDRLQTAISGVLSARTPPTVQPDDVEAFVLSIKRKRTFAAMHLKVLEGIEWALVDSIGTACISPEQAKKLTLNLGDSSLEIRHPTAVAHHVFLAVDGATAALANMTDTFARLVNMSYALNIPDRQASLFALREKCAPTSPLGAILRLAQHIAWLERIRELRGRCQHSDIASVLSNSTVCYGQSKEPMVPHLYSWGSPAVAMPVSAFVRTATAMAEAAIIAASNAIIQSPSNPV